MSIGIWLCVTLAGWGTLLFSRRLAPLPVLAIAMVTLWCAAAGMGYP